MLVILVLAVAPICAAFCSNAVADIIDPAALASGCGGSCCLFSKLGDAELLLGCRCEDDEGEDAVIGRPKRLPEVVDSMAAAAAAAAMFKVFWGGGRVLRGFLISDWVKSDNPIVELGLLFRGTHDKIWSETWPCCNCKLCLMVFTRWSWPWLIITLLFSSARASQKALWVMKLSLLQHQINKKSFQIFRDNKFGNKLKALMESKHMLGHI